MIIEMNITKYSFGEKDANIAFNLSLGMQVDEVDNSKLMNLNFYEFLESLSRISEKLNLAPYKENNKDWSHIVRKNLDLHIKLEAFMEILYDGCSNRPFKESFKMPDESFF